MSEELAELVADWTGRMAAVLFAAEGFYQFGRWVGQKGAQGECESAGKGKMVVFSLFGFLVLTLHIPLAIVLVHAGSHDVGYQATADRTLAVTGIDWGGGYYLNFVTWAAWGVELGLGSSAGLARRTGWLRRCCWWWVASMMFCSTVVFGPWGWGVLGVGYGAVLAAVYWRGRG